MNYLNADQEKLRIDLYRKGLDDHEIGDLVGRDHSSIANWRHRRNLKPNTSRGGYHRKKESSLVP